MLETIIMQTFVINLLVIICFNSCGFFCLTLLISHTYSLIFTKAKTDNQHLAFLNKIGKIIDLMFSLRNSFYTKRKEKIACLTVLSILSRVRKPHGYRFFQWQDCTFLVTNAVKNNKIYSKIIFYNRAH